MTNQWNTAEYDAKHAFVYQKAKGLVELLAPKAGERILDLGCGTGALTAEIAGRGAEVLGVDRSEAILSHPRTGRCKRCLWRYHVRRRLGKCRKTFPR